MAPPSRAGGAWALLLPTFLVGLLGVHVLSRSRSLPQALLNVLTLRDGGGFLQAAEEDALRRRRRLRPFEPPEVNCSEPLRIQLKSVQLEIPGPDGNGSVSLYTRAYMMPGSEAGVPGPTIRLRPGDLLNITVENHLTLPDPDCEETGAAAPTGPGAAQNSSSTVNESEADPGFYCHANTTNLHTHGLHVSGKPGADNVIVEKTGPQERPGLRIESQLPDWHMGGTFWYHAHHHHSTALQAGGGAVGAIIVEDPEGTLPEEIAKMPEVLAMITYLDTPFIADLAAQSLGNLFEAKSNFAGALVNGQYMPETEIEMGVWYRFRLLFASIRFVLQISKIGDAQCDFQLLAKDGVYLHTAPRAIDTIYLASGSRADVAVRCTCPPGQTECEMHLKSARGNESLTKNPFGDVRQVDLPVGDRPERNQSAVIDQLLLKATVVQGKSASVKANVEQGKSASIQPDLKPFQVARPCKLVDLRDAEKFGAVEKHTLGLQTPSANFLGLVSLDGVGDSFMMPADGSEPPPMATLPLQSLQEWHVMPVGAIPCGLLCHNFHLHVTPYQLQDLKEENSYFQNGDWHDTFTGTQEDMTVRFQLSTFTGPYVTHCHFLQHEDEGMMNYFNVTGTEGQTWAPAKLIDPQCYDSAAERDGLQAKFTYVSSESSETSTTTPSSMDVTGLASPTVGSSSVALVIVFMSLLSASGP